MDETQKRVVGDVNPPSHNCNLLDITESLFDEWRHNHYLKHKHYLGLRKVKALWGQHLKHKEEMGLSKKCLAAIAI